jgi:hypothetical protein
MDLSIFEKATRQHLRFDSTRGALSVEQLWSLPLTELDEIAQSIFPLVKKEDTLLPSHNPDPKAALQIQVLRRIAEVKIAEQQAEEQRLEKEAKRQKLLNLRERKEEESLSSLSLEEIDAELAALS